MIRSSAVCVVDQTQTVFQQRTVSTQFQHSVNTVSTQFQHSVNTVSTQCQHSVNTVSTQFQHSVNTVSTTRIPIRLTVASLRLFSLQVTNVWAQLGSVEQFVEQLPQSGWPCAVETAMFAKDATIGTDDLLPVKVSATLYL